MDEKINVSVEDIIEQLHLEALPVEGGMFRSTYHSKEQLDGKDLCNAIYYLLHGKAFSHLHKLPQDEIYHFYMGDPLELLELCPDGSSHRRILGTDLSAGQEPQIVMHAGCYQGSRCLPGGRAGYTLVGTTNAPGYTDEGYEHLKDLEWALKTYPEHAELIKALTGNAE